MGSIRPNPDQEIEAGLFIKANAQVFGNKDLGSHSKALAQIIANHTNTIQEGADRECLSNEFPVSDTEFLLVLSQKHSSGAVTNDYMILEGIKKVRKVEEAFHHRTVSQRSKEVNG